MGNYSIISIIIGIITVFSSNISSLSGIVGIFSGNNAIIRRDITHLGQNVVLLDNCKVAQIYHIAQYIQLLIPKLPVKQCIQSLQISKRILLIELVSNVHMIYRMKNKPILKTRGGYKLAFKEQLRLNIITKYGNISNFCKLAKISQPNMSRSLRNNAKFNYHLINVFKRFNVYPEGISQPVLIVKSKVNSNIEELLSMSNSEFLTWFVWANSNRQYIDFRVLNRFNDLLKRVNEV